jgi:hypothetical protein
VCLELGVFLLELGEGVRVLKVCRLLRFCLGDVGLEALFEIEVLMGQVPSLDVGFDGELADVEPPAGSLDLPGEQPGSRPLSVAARVWSSQVELPVQKPFGQGTLRIRSARRASATAASSC